MTGLQKKYNVMQHRRKVHWSAALPLEAFVRGPAAFVEPCLSQPFLLESFLLALLQLSHSLPALFATTQKNMTKKTAKRQSQTPMKVKKAQTREPLTPSTVKKAKKATVKKSPMKANTNKPQSPMKATKAKTSKLKQAENAKTHDDDSASSDGALQCSVCRQFWHSDISECVVCLRPMCCNCAASDFECACGALTLTGADGS